MTNPARGSRSAGARIRAAAVLLGASVLLSRVLGYLREALLAHRIGAGPEADAFYAAFTIPDLLNYLLAGGALSIAFIPRYARTRETEGEAAAAHLLATVAGTLGAVAVLATLVLWWFAGPLVQLQFPRFDSPTQELCVRLTRIVLPAQIFFIVGGLVQGALMARGRFVASAIAPVIYNGGIIVGGWFGATNFGVEGFAWGALAGALLGPCLVPLLDARRRMPLRLRCAATDRAFLGYLAVAAPLMLGQSLLTVDEWYGRWFGGLLGAGTVAHLAYARRLVLVPVAVVGQAVGAAALPTLARLHAAGEDDELGRLVGQTLRAAFAFALLAAAGFMVFATPLVTLVYQRGAFGAADTDAVAGILRVSCLAVPFWVLQQVAVRAFYARGDTLRPMLWSSTITLGAIPVYLQFGTIGGARGIALAGVVGIGANALLTLALARWWHGAPSLRAIAGSGLRGLVVALLASLPAWAAGAWLETAWAEPVLAGHANQSLTGTRLLALGVEAAVFAVAALLAIRWIGDQILRDTTRRILARAVRRRGGS